MENFEERIIAALEAIEDATLSDKYEYSDPYTIGGATGSYFIKSPYNTECDWVIVAAAGVGTLASQASFVAGSKNPNQTTVAATNTFGSMSTSSPDDNNALPSFVGTLTSQASFITYDASNFMPLGMPPIVYLQTTTPASSAVFVTVQFRRLLARYIPDKPRQKPHTHTHVGSRAPSRRLAAQSTMVAGFESQYPEAGGRPYGHQPLGPQDTAMVKRGAFPLGPVPTPKKGKLRGR
jgi:hypothetical protein